MKPVRVLTLASLLISPAAFAGEASEKAAADLLEKRLENEKPEDLSILKAVQGRDVVVVQGSMDHIESVLAAANIRHSVIRPDQVGDADLSSHQILMVNCPGNIPKRGIERIRKFVRAGGLLYTTDWALLNVVQKAFPGTIAHNGRSTGDHVTRVHVHAKHDDVMSNMLLTKGARPEWWLEGGSYPIKILNKDKVEVLASSAQMQKRYGASPVVVRFRWDDGEVIHVVSHFYRQAETNGPSIAAAAAVDDMEGLTPAQKEDFKKSGKGGDKLSNVASSYAFQRMTSNVVVSKQRRNKRLDERYNFTPKSEVVIDGRKVKKGDRVRILEKKGKRVRVRDDRGNEAELPAAAVEAL